ncbi:MAG TPA: alpha/beta fold hydrolase [Blastocatellia bacterium]|nr:alpha/beta fold hydrolase [Blastocatellia bacterium]
MAVLINGKRSQRLQAAPKPVTWSVGSAQPRRTVIGNVGIAWYDSSVETANHSEPLILIHGFCSMSYTWHEVFDQLAARRRVIAVDLKGFGASDKPPDGNYLIDTQAAIVTGLMDALKLSRAALAGNSLGGAVALQIARNSPQRVSELVLANPAVSPADQFPLLARLILLSGRRSGERLPARIIGHLVRIPGLIESRIRHAHYRAATVTPERVAAYSAMLSEPECQRAIAATLRTFDLRQIAGNLSSVHHRTLIIQGAYDRIIRPESGAALSRAMPRAELMMLPCGHAPQEEMPAEFARIVNEFLESVSAERSVHENSLAVR